MPDPTAPISVAVIAADAEPAGVVAALESARGQVEGAQLLVAGPLAGDAALEDALVPFDGDYRAVEADSPAAARNAALEAAAAELIVFVDAHERLAPGALERHISALSGTELVGSYGRTGVHDRDAVRVRPEQGKGGQIFHRLLKVKHLMPSSAAGAWRCAALRADPFPLDYRSSAALRLHLALSVARAGGEFIFHPAVLAERTAEKLALAGLEELVKVFLSVVYSAEPLEEKEEQQARFRLARHLVAIGKHHYRENDTKKAGKFFDEAVRAAPSYFRGRRYQFLNFVKNTLTRS